MAPQLVAPPRDGLERDIREHAVNGAGVLARRRPWSTEAGWDIGGPRCHRADDERAVLLVDLVLLERSAACATATRNATGATRARQAVPGQGRRGRGDPQWFRHERKTSSRERRRFSVPPAHRVDARWLERYCVVLVQDASAGACDFVWTRQEAFLRDPGQRFASSSGTAVRRSGGLAASTVPFWRSWPRDFSRRCIQSSLGRRDGSVVTNSSANARWHAPQRRLAKPAGVPPCRIGARSRHAGLASAAWCEAAPMRSCTA